MTQTSFPWSGTTPGDAGPYTAARFAEILRILLGQEIFPDASVQVDSGDGTNDPLEITETTVPSTQVRVRPGDAIVHGYVYKSDDNENLTIAANSSGNPRIDSVILEVVFADQEVRLAVLQGTPAGSPSAPTLTQNTAVWQVRIANVAVANLFTSIVNADITNTVRKPSHPGRPPTGSMIPYAGSESTTVIPDGWLFCDGAAVSRTTYARLFRAIGTTYGVGDGATTFNLPDTRGRALIGVSNASLPNGAAGGAISTRNRGSTGGTETHTLTSAELASHQHQQRGLNTGGGAQVMTQANVTALNTTPVNHSTFTANNTSADGAHNNMQPFAIVNYLIKT